jgi:hypothetical protein
MTLQEHDRGRIIGAGKRTVRACVTEGHPNNQLCSQQLELMLLHVCK